MRHLTFNPLAQDKMLPVFTRVLLPIWATALASGKKPFEVQRYVGAKKNFMTSLIKSALVIVGEKGSSSIVAIARVFACRRDVASGVRDQFLALMAGDRILESNLAKYFQGDAFDVCYFDIVYDMRKLRLTWKDLEKRTQRTFARNCGFCKVPLSWEGHIFIQDLLERPAAIKYQCTWPSLSVNDEDEMSVSTSVPDSDGRDENMPDDQVPDVNVSDKGRTSAKRRRIN